MSFRGRRDPEHEPWSIGMNGPYRCPVSEDGHHSYAELTRGDGCYLRECACGALFYREDSGAPAGFFWEWAVEDGE